MAKKILIIEDEISIQNIVRAFLEDAGYTVYGAGDGLEGIRKGGHFFTEPGRTVLRGLQRRLFVDYLGYNYRVGRKREK